MSNSMEKSCQIAWKNVPLRQFFPLKVVPLIEVLLYTVCDWSVCKTERGAESELEVLIG
jgi:hypothetical protein